MVNQKVVELASQAAAAHMSELMSNIHQAEPEPTVYAYVFNNTLKACGISEVALRERVLAFAKDQFGDTDAAKSMTGNLMKESTNPNMGAKIFLKLTRALFPHPEE